MPDLPHENEDGAGEEEELPDPQELVDKARALALSTDGLTAGVVSLRSAQKARASSIGAIAQVPCTPAYATSTKAVRHQHHHPPHSF